MFAQLIQRGMRGSLLILLALWLGPAQSVHAQTGRGLTAHVGVGANGPVGQTADYIHWSGTLSAGVGYRFKEGQSALVQYSYFALPFHKNFGDSPLNLTPESRLYAVTGNYKIDLLRNHKFNPYVIAGGGWYRRVTSINRTSLVGEALCNSGLPWWDLACDLGAVSGELTVASSNLDAMGFNGGAGVSSRISNTSAHWYAEVRYHYAPHQGVPTRLLPLVFGLTW